MPKERKKGNRTIERSFTLEDSFSFFERKIKEKGYRWVQRWGLEPYRSIWINPEELTTFTYCEGDLIKVICDDQAAFLDELRDNNEYYKRF